MIENINKRDMEKVRNFRRELHKIPEIGLDTFRTTDLIENALSEAGFSFRRIGSKNTGIVSMLDNSKNYTVSIRADIDGLKIKEETGLQYSSVIEGQMHACGHDAHAAILFGTMLALKDVQNRLKCNVQFIFQPGEEGFNGAKDIFFNGLSELTPSSDEFLALHLCTGLEVGKIATRPGAIMASLDYFQLKIEGKSGHLGMPHLCIDPIYAASQFVSQTQSIVSRFNNPVEPIVISFQSIHSSSAYGQIPKSVHMDGTIRCIEEISIGKIKNQVVNLLEGLKISHNIRYDLDFSENNSYLPTMNDESLVERVRKINFKDVQLVNTYPLMGADDFAFFSRMKPSCYFLLGCCSDSFPQTNLHTSTFNFDESCIEAGISFYCDYLMGVKDD